AEHDAGRRDRVYLSVHVDQPAHLSVALERREADRSGPAHVPDADRNHANEIDVGDSGERRKHCARRCRNSRYKLHRERLTLCNPELETDHVVGCIVQRKSTGHHCERRSHARRTEQRAARLPFEAPDYHAYWRTESQTTADRVERQCTITRRSRWLERLGWWQNCDLADSAERAAERGEKDHDHRATDHHPVGVKLETGDAEHVTVDARIEASHPDTDTNAERYAHGCCRRRIGEVVQTHGAAGVSKRLEHRDLFALGCDEARDDGSDEERSDGDKDRRKCERHHSHLSQLVRNNAVRQLILATNRPAAAVRSEERIDRGYHFGRVCPCCQPNGN